MGETTVAAAADVTVPAAAELRARLRRWRRAHHTGSPADLLTDLYMGVLLLAIYGPGAVYLAREHLDTATTTSPGAQWWAGLAIAVAGAGLAWRGLRTVGPLVVAPATMAWAVSSPVDRGAWLRPRFRWLVAGAGTAAGSLALAAAALAGARGVTGLAAAAVAGAATGAGGVALAVVAQGTPGERAWHRRLGGVLLAAGAAVALVVALAELAGASLPRPPARLAVAAALVAAPAAVVAVGRGARALGRVDRASLTAGAQVVTAATTASVAMDPTLLTALLEVRRWRAVGRVRSRPLRGGRLRVLVRAELRRLGRRPGVLAAWVLLGLAVYAVAAALPPFAGPAHLVFGYLAVNGLAGGLRVVCRSAGLRRALGGREEVLHLAHLVVPTLGALVWYLLTLPAVRPQVTWLDAAFLTGLLTATYRTASRQPIEYGGVAVDTPFGLIPADLVRQVARGPDVVAGMVVFQVMFVA